MGGYMKISVCMATYNGEKYIKEQMLEIVNFQHFYTNSPKLHI